MRRRFRKLNGHRRVLAVVVVAVLAAAVGALAYWTAPGSGTASGSVGTLNPPTGASASSTGGSSTVAVSWTASAPANGLLPIGYYVKRWNGGTPTLAGGTCGSPGSPVNQTSCSDTSVADGTYTYSVVAVYQSWTAESTHSSSVTVASDVTPPTDSLSFSGASGAFLSSGTLYFKGNAAGQFNLIDTVSDSGSGPASATFPTLTASNWTTHSAETVSTPAGGPYTSSVLKWSAGAGTPATYTVTSKDNAGNTSAGSTLTFVSDTTAPTGGALTVNGKAASSEDPATYNNTGSFTISAITDYTDSGSGLASSTLTRQSATLSSSNGIENGACGSFGTATTISSRSVPIAETQTGPYCYLYTLTGTDKVGNTLSISTTVKVDTTAPSTPAITLSGATGNTFINGTTAFINPQTGKSGSFKASATTTDADSGILKVNFPGLTGFESGGGDITSSPFETTYNWSGSGATASGSQTVTSTNNANLTKTASFTVTPDSTNPTGGALTVNSVAASGPGTASSNNTGSFTISAITDYTDSGSGLASSTLTRQSATLSSSNGIGNGVCGTFGTATTISSRSVPIAETQTGPHCYLYTLTGTDKVGNTLSISTTVKVDTTAPSAPAITLSGETGNTFINGTTAFINPQTGKSGSFKASATTTDNDSGILKVNFPALTGFSSGGGDITSSPFETTYNWSGSGASASGSQTVTATDNANLTNTASFTVTPDTTAPTGGALSVNGVAATTGAGSSTYATSTGFQIEARTDYSETPSASQSGLASSTLTIQSESFTNNVCGAPSGKYASPTTISGTTNPTIEAGFCYVYILAGTDNVGNVNSVTTTVKVDTVSPGTPTLGSINSFVATVTTFGATPPTLTATSVSDTGGSGVASEAYFYCTSGCASTPDSSPGSWTSIGSSSTSTGNYPVQWTGSIANGSYTVIARTRDNAGNDAFSTTTTTTVDNSQPNAPTLGSIPANVATVTTFGATPPKLTATSVSDNTGGSGVASEAYFYCTSGCASTPDSSPGSWTSIGSSSTSTGNYPVEWTASIASGTYTVISKTRDNAGNDAFSTTTTTTVDNSQPNAPTLGPINSFVATVTTFGATPPTLTATSVSDTGGSGVASEAYFYCTSGCASTPDSSPGSWTSIGSSSTSTGNYPVQWTGSIANGSYTVIARTRDNVGNDNFSTTKTTTVKNTAETLTITSCKEEGASHNWPCTGTYSQNAGDSTSITLNYYLGSEAKGTTGGGSPISVAGASGSWSGKDSSKLTSGQQYTVQATVTDSAGNVTKSGTVNIASG